VAYIPVLLVWMVFDKLHRQQLADKWICHSEDSSNEHELHS
jgi:hypothetical protein